MADKRKFFRARRLACGGRSLPRLCLLAASLAVMLAAGPVHAQDAGLKSGAASLAAGKYDAAVRQLSAAINAGTASPGDAAKALYLRGIAYRKMGEPARAAADLGAAIWLGLPEADRVKALVNRGLAFKAAGLSKESEAEFASARKVGGSREVDQLIADGGGTPEGAAAIAAFSTEVRPEGQPSASAKPRSSWLPSFGRGDAGDAAPAPQPEPTPTRTASASPQASAPTSKPAAGAPGAWSTSVASEQQQTSSSSGGNRLTRWFGSRTDASPAAPPPAAPTPAAPAPAPAAETAAASPPPSKPPSAPPAAAASSSWSTTTANQDASSPLAEAKAREAGVSSAAPGKPTKPHNLRRRARRPAATVCSLPPAAPRKRRRRCGKRYRRAKVLEAWPPKSRKSISAISARSTASRSAPSRTRRKALRSATR